jgi:hypothetical protein
MRVIGDGITVVRSEAIIASWSNSAENRTGRDRPQCPAGTRGAPAGARASTTKHLRPPQLLVDPRHPARKRLAIERARAIRIALVPTNKKLN